MSDKSDRLVCAEESSNYITHHDFETVLETCHSPHDGAVAAVVVTVTVTSTLGQSTFSKYTLQQSSPD